MLRSKLISGCVYWVRFNCAQQRRIWPKLNDIFNFEKAFLWYWLLLNKAVIVWIFISSSYLRRLCPKMNKRTKQVHTLMSKVTFYVLDYPHQSHHKQKTKRRNQRCESNIKQVRERGQSLNTEQEGKAIRVSTWHATATKCAGPKRLGSYSPHRELKITVSSSTVGIFFSFRGS